MSVLYILFAFGLLASGQATGEELCPNRTWNPETDEKWNRCLYYCSDGGNGWLTGYFPDGTSCYYDVGQENGTCYKGYCYWRLPDDAIIPSTTVSSPKVSKKEKPRREPPALNPRQPMARPLRNRKTKEKKEKEDEKKIRKRR
uniref:Putative salivary secreted basic tail protein n=1 Tax=Rhipicephalus microplus TaxID=6941 RepID=A0A6G5A3B9_RHIMP